MQHIAQHLCARSQIGRHVGGADIFLQVTLVGPRPARGEAIRHAERPDHLGIAQRRVRQHLPLRAQVHRGLGRAARQAFGQQCHRDDRDGAEQRGDADRRMKQKQGNEENRNPRHIQKRRRPHAGHEAAHLVEIAQGLLHQHRLDAAQRQRGERGVDVLLHAGIEQRCHPAQHACAQRVEIALQQVSQQHD